MPYKLRRADLASPPSGYGSLIEKYGKVAAGFTLPTIIIVGILYSLVTSRAILFQVSRLSRASGLLADPSCSPCALVCP